MARAKAEGLEPIPEKKGGRKKWIIIAAVPLLLSAAGGGAYMFLLRGYDEPAAAKSGPAQAGAPQTAFVEIPEMSLTMTNGGQPRQMRIRIALEVVAAGPNAPQPAVLSPRVYDFLLTYLRTLTEAEVQGSLAIDRIRGDLFRRLELLLGPNVVRDVLITSLITA